MRLQLLEFVCVVALPVFATAALAESGGLSNSGGSDHRIVAANGNGAFRDTTVEAVELPVDGVAHPDQDGVIWSYDFSAIGSRYVRLYFDQITSPPGAVYCFKIFDQDSAQLIADFSQKDFASKGDFFTTLLPSGRLQLRLTASSPQSGLHFRLVSIIRGAADASPVPRQSAPRWDLVTSYPSDSDVLKAAPAVGLIHVGTPPIVEACTGTLARPDLVVTSFHCMAASTSFAGIPASSARMCAPGAVQTCSDVVIEFDVLTMDKVGVTAQCQRVVAYDRKDDFVVLSIRPGDILPTSGQRRPVEIGSLVDPSNGLPVTIIHHPLGFPLVAEDSCKTRGTTGTDILHNCDTQSGSSGAPLFDKQMHWVGTHYRGPYPDGWTGKQIEEYLKEVAAGRRPGPVSHARAATDIMKCALGDNSTF